MLTVGYSMKLTRNTKAASLSNAIAKAFCALSENDADTYVESLITAQREDVLIIFTQRLTTLFYPMTPIRDLHYATQRLYEFHDAVLDLMKIGIKPSDDVGPFIRATNRLAQPGEIDDLTSLVYQTLINHIAKAMLERKP